MPSSPRSLVAATLPVQDVHTKRSRLGEDLEYRAGGVVQLFASVPELSG